MAWTRFLLHCLTVAMLALGIASAPLYAVAQPADAPSVAEHHHEHMTMVGQGSPRSRSCLPAKPHAMVRTCCHPGCIMAVVPGFASLTTALLPWVAIPIPRDQVVVSVASSGPDRPPKLA